MSKHCYVIKRFNQEAKMTIARALRICEEYAAAGYTLTLRQLYYQFVARGFLPNEDKEYKKLGGIIGDARLAGLIDWEHLEDRTRNLHKLTHFSGPQDALNRLKAWYHIDLWEHQRYRPEVWIEKDALLGVVQGVCEENDVPYFSCRGYTSLSEIWRASVRLREYAEDGQTPYIIHFGDHDPSGIDMSRDICDRIQDTFRTNIEFQRVALNMDQIQEFQPPPNPAKITDTRYKAYLAKFGEESWELDALDPKSFRELVLDQLDSIRDDKQWDSDVARKEKVRAQLAEVAKDWEAMLLSHKQMPQVRSQLEKAAEEKKQLLEELTALKAEKLK